jgi:hypothetical protein
LNETLLGQRRQDAVDIPSSCGGIDYEAMLQTLCEFIRRNARFKHFPDARCRCV